MNKVFKKETVVAHLLRSISPTIEQTNMNLEI